MALRDTACYTLFITPSARHADHAELSESGGVSSGHSTHPGNGSEEKKGQLRYVRVKESREGEVYSSVIYDAFSGAKLASMGYAQLKDKKRRLELHGPDEIVPFEFTGKINFEWTFSFHGNKFRWTREVYGKDYICSIDRKPDPRVEVCLAREADKKDPARLQILHYNLDRFVDEIQDIRGLETLLVASLMMIIDAADDRTTKSGTITHRPLPCTSPAGSSSRGSDSGPPIPDKPVKVISEEDFEPENPNEIIVGLNTNIDEHVARAVGLLEDQHTLFVVVRTRNPAAAQRALEVSLGVKRFRHRENMDNLNQYVVEEEEESSSSQPQRPGPQVINLDDPTQPPKPSSPIQKGSREWKAPNIAVYLSKIELPDLTPGRRETLKSDSNGDGIGSLDSALKPSSSSTSRPVISPSSSQNRPVSSGSGPVPPPPPERPVHGALTGDAPSVSGSGSHGSHGKSTSSSGGVSLTRLFKAAASKV